MINGWPKCHGYTMTLDAPWERFKFTVRMESADPLHRDQYAEGSYRYILTRQWSENPMMMWIMLNPSTGDDRTDDPTLRRCMGFSEREGAGGIIVVNLFATRTQSPKQLSLAPIQRVTGRDNFNWVEYALKHSVGDIVGGWGTSCNAGDIGIARRRSMDIIQRLARHQGRRLVCLAKNKDGSPKHPLYVPGDQPFTPLIPRNF